MADQGDWRSRVTRLWMFTDGTAPWSFDAVVRESHHSELTVTDNPLETGVVVSDHAFMSPLRLEIEADVGDFWLHALDANGDPVADEFASEAGRSVNAFQLVQALQSAAEPFSVQTGLSLYGNMLITSLDVDQDASTASVLRFRATLREVIFVSTQTITYPPRAAGKTTRQASKKVSAGEKKTVEPEAAKQQSILKSLISGDVSGAQTGLQSLLGGP